MTSIFDSLILDDFNTIVKNTENIEKPETKKPNQQRNASPALVRIHMQHKTHGIIIRMQQCSQITELVFDPDNNVFRGGQVSHRLKREQLQADIENNVPIPSLDDRKTTKTFDMNVDDPANANNETAILASIVRVLVKHYNGSKKYDVNITSDGYGMFSWLETNQNEPSNENNMLVSLDMIMMSVWYNTRRTKPENSYTMHDTKRDIANMLVKYPNAINNAKIHIESYQKFKHDLELMTRAYEYVNNPPKETQSIKELFRTDTSYLTEEYINNLIIGMLYNDRFMYEDDVENYIIADMLCRALNIDIDKNITHQSRYNTDIQMMMCEITMVKNAKEHYEYVFDIDNFVHWIKTSLMQQLDQTSATSAASALYTYATQYLERAIICAAMDTVRPYVSKINKNHVKHDHLELNDIIEEFNLENDFTENLSKIDLMPINLKSEKFKYEHDISGAGFSTLSDHYYYAKVGGKQKISAYFCANNRDPLYTTMAKNINFVVEIQIPDNN